MGEYRLYCLDGAKRIQRAAEVIAAQDDGHAIDIARGLDMPMACELWQGRRLVASIPAAKS
ncbi:hypothetical protein [Sphingomonas sp.]|uniref:hypothetical protein n=1 Tax=Sphingomonas sp. TaxID=28214 RepID=UPI00286CC6BD|nr:hypothetical protein [Sphingomonas sp.]